MINGNNLIQISGRLTADAEYVMDGKMLRFSIAVDRAGYEKGSDSNTGFFNCKIWMTENAWTASGVIEAIKSLVSDGRLAKGSPVRIVGSLNQDRYTDSNDNRRSEVNITVETIESYARRDEGTSTTSEDASTAPLTGTASAVVTKTATAGTEPF